MGNLGKIILAEGFEKFPNESKFRSIWSHYMGVFLCCSLCCEDRDCVSLSCFCKEEIVSASLSTNLCDECIPFMCLYFI